MRRKAIKFLSDKIEKLKFKLWHHRYKKDSAKFYERLRKTLDSSRVSEIEPLLKEVFSFATCPLISILMPVYNVDEKWLRRAIESVLNQSYENWELCIADDNSSFPHIKKTLQEYSRKDARIKVSYRKENGHIARASNTALELAEGEFVGLLDNDDELHQDALLYIARELLNFPQTTLIYTDEDKITKNNRHFDPTFKPEWNPELFYSLNFINHFCVLRRDILQNIGGFRQEFTGSQDYDLLLRFIEEVDFSQIRHIPQILYHWRAIENSVALDSGQKSYAHDAARNALQASLKRKKIDAEIVRGFDEYHRVVFEMPPNTKATLIFEITEEKSFAVRLESFLEDISPEKPEVIVLADKNGTEKNFCEDISHITKVISIDFEKINKVQRLNAAARQATGEILIFISENLKNLTEDWFREIASQTARTEIGSVSPKILDRKNLVRFAGFLLDEKNIYHRFYHKFPDKIPGNLARLQVASNFSAVSIDFLAVKRSDFESLAGFDDKNFPKSLFDIDFCLRLEKKGRRNLLLPFVKFQEIKKERESKISEQEQKAFHLRWKERMSKEAEYLEKITLLENP